MRSRPRYLGIIVLMTVLCLPLASPLAAQTQVIDQSNLVQNVLQVLRMIEQLQNQVDQLETMVKNLERIEDPNWRDLRALVAQLQELASQGEALAYTTESLFETFRTFLPGYVAVPNVEGAYEDVYGGWTTITLDTLAATLDTARAQAETYLSSEEQLAELRDLADSAEGNLEALNVLNMFQGHLAQEVSKLNQLMAATMNAQNVYWGFLVTREATQEATERLLIEESTEPFHVYNGLGGLTGIPPGWPYPCPLCP